MWCAISGGKQLMCLVYGSQDVVGLHLEGSTPSIVACIGLQVYSGWLVAGGDKKGLYSAQFQAGLVKYAPE